MSSTINALTAVTPITTDITNVVSSPFAPGDDHKVTLAALSNLVTAFIKRTGTATDYTALSTDSYIGVTDTSIARTITLPAAAGVGSGKLYVIKDESGAASTNNVVIDGNAAETINGALTFAINLNYGSVNLICDGANWFTW